MYTKSYVYFISDGEYIKIGFAKNAQKRLSDMQTGNGRKLSILHSVECISEYEANNLERILHRRFSKQRVHGEWFSVSPTQVEEIPFDIYLHDAAKMSETQHRNLIEGIRDDMLACLYRIAESDEMSIEEKRVFFAKARESINIEEITKELK